MDKYKKEVLSLMREYGKMCMYYMRMYHESHDHFHWNYSCLAYSDYAVMLEIVQLRKKKRERGIK